MPVSIAVNSPLGASACLLSFIPQHARVRFVRSAQVWLPPAAMAVNCPLGASIWPWALFPQQAML